MNDVMFERDADAYFPLGFPMSGEACTAFNAFEWAAASGEGPTGLTHAVRRLADAMNRRGGQAAPVSAGELLVFGVLEEVMRYLIDFYCLECVPEVRAAARAWVLRRDGEETVTRPCLTFVTLYPPRYGGAADEEDLLAIHALDQAERYRVVCELGLLSLAMENPALEAYRPLFDDAALERQAAYTSLVGDLEVFFAQQPPVPRLGQGLFDVLRGPMRACPHSLQGQLEYIKMHWTTLLPQWLCERLTMAADTMKEETRMRGPGPGPAAVLRFDNRLSESGSYPEPVGFTQDRDWMANVVLIAKNVYVWLDQLSKRSHRSITRLDEVPEEELERLGRWGFTGLWLIGLWERSSASRRIKQIMGNPEAAASAYSLYDYMIAADLGGESAFEAFRERAARYGLRVASDMVPNHVGIHSKWVTEHPDWFIQSDHPPFPAYQFTGVDLSEDPRVRIRIDDGYWGHRDAAVVFERVDTATGQTRYLYHGNDGTSMPWNDTAQLNFLLPQVREAVVETILHVARQFRIIRFDAAMTLTKKHFQRLWFPKPGDGGAIPSRTEHGMSQAEFDQHFPKEFWREVVDRLMVELPDTLLIAEAFWLMEGYFVRTLGMHRVYNSAFMNMLKMEENANYRQTVKNVLEFSPPVLQRFVNFMNNPDEQTAVEQFGKDDKYYGVAMLMVTMPGLPMFGHGQIEGLTEKYGMEYRKAYWDETPDEHMIYRHEAEIFPLMRLRRLFSGAENFALYDFVVPDGWVDENVFAYSNRCGEERALILYNNAYNTTAGTIRLSTSMNVAAADAPDPYLVRKSLAEALALRSDEGCYYVFRDHRTCLEYLRRARRIAEEGLWFTLEAYQYHAFLDFREVEDHDGLWAKLEGQLAGKGVASLEEAYQELAYAFVLEPLGALLNAASLGELTQPRPWPLFEAALDGFLASVIPQAASEADLVALTVAISEDVEAFAGLKACLARLPETAGAPWAVPEEEEGTPTAFGRVAAAWVTLLRLSATAPLVETPDEAPACIPQRPVRRILARAFADLGADDWTAQMDALLVLVMLEHDDLILATTKTERAARLARLFEDPSAQAFLQMNRHEGVLWLRQEAIESLAWCLAYGAAVASHLDAEVVALAAANAQRLLDAAELGGYDVAKILERLT